ncbi:MAG: periplasmic heavy metal sensor [Bacteroidota bacterium]
MNYFNKTRVVFWIMILVIVLNVSAFTSFLFYFKANRAPAADTTSCSGTCRFLNEQLALTPEQSARVKEINNEFRSRTEPVVAEIKNTRTALLDELSLDKPDTSKINACSSKISDLQKVLQKAAIVQFQQLRQVCNPEQCLKLSAIYSEIYGCTKMSQGKGMQHRNGKDQGGMECGKKQ